MSEKQVIEAIRAITKRGNNAEIKIKSDGTLIVYEVKKSVYDAKKNIVVT